KLADVRGKGDSPISKELTQGGVLFIAAIMLLWIGEWLIDAFSEVLRTGLTVNLEGRSLTDINGILAELWRALTTVFPPFATLLLVLLGSTMLIGYGQIGVKIAREA